MTFKEEVLRRIKQQFADRLGGQYSYSRESLPGAWENLIDDTGVDLVWQGLEEEGYVRMVSSPDDLTWDDLVGDTFNDEHADTIPGGMRELNAQRQRMEERIDSDGQWFYESWVRDRGGDGWHSVDSIGGFIGGDFEDSGYKPDMQVAALDAIADQHSLPHWRECHHDPRQRPHVFASMLALAGIPIDGGFQWTQQEEA